VACGTAYHAGLIRTSIYEADPVNTAGLLTLTQKISKVRATASGVPDDVGITRQTDTLNGAPGPAVTIADVDANSLAYTRTTSQVLAIVTGGTASPYKGLFFPAGLNGTIV